MSWIVLLKILWLVNLCTGFAPMWLTAGGVLYLLDKKLHWINSGIDWDC